MRLPRRHYRRGASLLEAAIILIVFLILVCGMIDLCMAVTKHNILSAAARHGVRQTSIHGRRALPESRGEIWTGEWSPDPNKYPGRNPHQVNVYNRQGDKVVRVLAPYLVGLDPRDTDIVVEWLEPDNPDLPDPASNDVGRGVRVSVYTEWRPMMTFIFGNITYTLGASSTMRIAH